ncbi:MAG: archaemetzincin family Zn-dependent metalloprotease [Candidatus Bathyarchaeia archaeon]
MKVGILRIGQIDQYVVDRIRENLEIAFPKTTCTIIHKELPVPKETFDKTRNQYNSEAILSMVKRYAEKAEALNRILGIVNIDIFVSGLNFVFGEAECPGKTALISLWRLKPEFYGKPSNINLLLERSTKEAVHELGHTLGLKHCSNPFCVMYFSNSIFETDRKQSLFCNKCHFNVESTINNLG